jgi:hypothetical protein
MTPRDLFDWFLLAVLVVALAVGSGGVAFSMDLLRAVIASVLAIDPAVYLILGGVLGTVFVGYIAVYLPWKLNEQRSR